MADAFLCIGECMVEMAPTDEGTYAMGFAGDTFNTAWYARKLLSKDRPVAYLSAVGTDAVSDKMLDFMQGAGVDVRFMSRIPERTVGLYMIHLDHGERSFSYWRSASAARCLTQDKSNLRQGLAQAGIAYFSGITLAILTQEDRCTLLAELEAARANGCIIAFDPNLRPRLWPETKTMCAAVMRGAEVADIVLPSFEDEAAWFGDADTTATARRYSEAGASVVMVKNGASEALSLSHGAIMRHPVRTVDRIVDTTAAGDSFNAAFLASYLDHGDIAAAAEAGVKQAAWVVGRRGALV